MRNIMLTGLLFFMFLSSLLIALPPQTTYAQAQGVCAGANASFLSFPTWYKYLDFQEASDGTCDVSADIPEDVGKIVLAIFEIILRIGGLVAVVMVVYGGIQYVLSQGEPDRTKTAKNTIINAMIGLVIAMSSVAVVNLIARNII